MARGVSGALKRLSLRDELGPCSRTAAVTMEARWSNIAHVLGHSERAGRRSERVGSRNSDSERQPQPKRRRSTIEGGFVLRLHRGGL